MNEFILLLIIPCVLFPILILMVILASLAAFSMLPEKAQNKILKKLNLYD
jgi:hypothetical protein